MRPYKSTNQLQIYKSPRNYKSNTNLQKLMDDSKIIYKDLSYQVVGILFEVYNELGYGYHEKYYAYFSV